MGMEADFALGTNPKQTDFDHCLCGTHILPNILNYRIQMHLNYIISLANVRKYCLFSIHKLGTILVLVYYF